MKLSQPTQQQTQHLSYCFLRKSMAPMNQILQDFQAMPFAFPAAIAALSLLFLFSVKALIFPKKNTFSKLPSVPVVPGLPVVGNLLQLKEKKPYKTFTRWAEEYGPIYSIRTGATTMVVLNTADVAKEKATSQMLKKGFKSVINGIPQLDQLAREPAPPSPKFEPSFLSVREVGIK